MANTFLKKLIGLDRYFTSGSFRNSAESAAETKFSTSPLSLLLLYLHMAVILKSRIKRNKSLHNMLQLQKNFNCKDRCFDLQFGFPQVVTASQNVCLRTVKVFFRAVRCCAEICCPVPAIYIQMCRTSRTMSDHVITVFTRIACCQFTYNFEGALSKDYALEFGVKSLHLQALKCCCCYESRRPNYNKTCHFMHEPLSRKQPLSLSLDAF